jgi:C4-dicarboxylate-specific signal transduction histidine kinase
LRYISAAGRALAAPGAQALGEIGEVVYVGTAIDVSARRAAEDTLRQAQAELARVARVTTVGQLTASIAHEVNQPLMSISANAGASLRWLERSPPDIGEARAGLRDIAEQSQRAGAIIAGLQALTRKAPPMLAPVDLHQTVRDILAISRAELERNNIALELALMAVSGVVLGDAVQLQQLLLNIVINAVEAMAEVQGRARLLAICSWSTDGGRIAVRIDDAGVGWPCLPGLDTAQDRAADALFEPFYTTKPHGMGMGLAICRSIVTAHHGTVAAMPRQPHGCTVVFYLPELPELPGGEGEA